MKKIIFSFLSALFLALAINEKSAAQDTELMQQICKEKVSQLSGYISNMASKDNPLNLRQWYKNKACKMFLGEGESYTDFQGITQTGVKTTVRTIKGPEKQMLTSTFLARCANLIYSKPCLATKNISVKQINNNTYTCVVQGVECFIQYHDNEYSVLFGDMEVTVSEI